MSHRAEQALIGRALRGDEGAFKSLYRTYQPRVYGVVASRAGNRDDAEDLVQMTFVRAFGALGSFRGEAAFSTWLTRIALNVCHSHRQSRGARYLWLDAMEDPEAMLWAEQSHGRGESPEETVFRREREDRVHEGIRRLPAPYRQAMWLRYVKDRSYEEITEELQVPMGTVKTWLHRARRQLKGAFQKSGEWAM